MTKEREHKRCHFQTLPLASGRRPKAKQEALARWAPTAPPGIIWAQTPGAQLKNSSQAPGRELAKHLQQVFRKVLLLLSFCCHFPNSSTLVSLTFWLSAKEFDPWRGRQTISHETGQLEKQHSAVTTTWSQVSAGRGPETKLLDLEWHKPSLCWSGFSWNARHIHLGRAADRYNFTLTHSLRLIRSGWWDLCSHSVQRFQILWIQGAIYFR